MKKYLLFLSAICIALITQKASAFDPSVTIIMEKKLHEEPYPEHPVEIEDYVADTATNYCLCCSWFSCALCIRVCLGKKLPVTCSSGSYRRTNIKTAKKKAGFKNQLLIFYRR